MKQPSGLCGMYLHKVQVDVKIADKIKSHSSMYQQSSFTQSGKRNKEKTQKIL
jgi:hypothetical protein